MDLLATLFSWLLTTGAWSLILGLLLTILVEWIVYIIGIKKNKSKLLLYSLLINCFTYPLVNFFFSSYSQKMYGGIVPNYEPLVFIGILEIIVFIIEIFLIKFLAKISYKRAVVVSLIANFLTVIIGLFILLIF